MLPRPTFSCWLFVSLFVLCAYCPVLFASGAHSSVAAEVDAEAELQSSSSSSLSSSSSSTSFSSFKKRSYCRYGDTSCWPTFSEISAFSKSLSSGARVVQHPANNKVAKFVGATAEFWNGELVPMYGLGSTSGALSSATFAGNEHENDTHLTHCPYPNTMEEAAKVIPTLSDYCRASVRNNPSEGWQPGIIVFPLNADDVVVSVKFAVAHNLCIMVAGSGHDYMNRHSCPDGLFIRTILFKSVEWPLEHLLHDKDPSNDQLAYSQVRFGSGLSFDEAHDQAAQKGRLVTSGWMGPVGIAGWSFGGGNGPFAPQFGLGADNIVAVEIITGDGVLLTANATDNSDLWQAIRGGGGSTWGVVTKITFKTFPMPNTGLSYVSGITLADVTNEELHRLSAAVDAFIEYSITLDKYTASVMYIIPEFADDPVVQGDNRGCGGHTSPATSWKVMVGFLHSGNDKKSFPFPSSLIEHFYPYLSLQNYKNYSAISQRVFAAPNIALMPTQARFDDVAGVVVSRTATESGQLAKAIKARLAECVTSRGYQCSLMRLYQDISGNIGSPQDSTSSVHPLYRSAVYFLQECRFNKHYLYKDFYPLSGSVCGVSYFANSCYRFGATQWRELYWGSSIYAKLFSTKRKYDPNTNFYCRHCVGSELTNVEETQPKHPHEQWNDQFWTIDERGMAQRQPEQESCIELQNYYDAIEQSDPVKNGWNKQNSNSEINNNRVRFAHGNGILQP